MEIKDLTGLSKPLKKLIEVVSNGVGTITKPYFIKKTADAKAYEIKIISEAIKENQETLKSIDYKDEKLSLESLDIDTLQKEPTIESRTQNRIEFKEQKRQNNIESITQKAAQNLESEETVSEEPVDDDWTNRFFDYAEDISNEEMQELWARILAGEVKKPKSYSLRTLELLRNLTKEEAQVFSKAANYVISSWNSPFLFKGKKEEFLSDFGLTFEDRLLLTEIGILQSESTITRRLPKNDTDSLIFFESAQYLIKVSKKSETPEHRIPIFRFSKIGIELLELITPSPNKNYLKEFSKSLEDANMGVEYAFILRKLDNGQYQHSTPWMKFS